jgi:hypothetical protein
MRWGALFLLLGTAAHAADSSDTYRADLRVGYLRAALETVRETPRDTLDRAFEYARVLDRGACSSAVIRLKVECLMTAAARYCKNKKAADAKRCPTYMDLAASSVLAERQLITTDRRYEILRRHRDPRRALMADLRRVQGALAVDFRLRMGAAGDGDDATLAKNIDRYCVLTADSTSYSWQACTSSLVVFIGARQRTQGRP